MCDLSCPAVRSPLTCGARGLVFLPCVTVARYCYRISVLPSVTRWHRVTRAQQLLRWAGDRARAKWAEKWGTGCCALSVGEAGSQSDTMWPGPRPTSISSGILIHLTVWPQYANVTDRQTDRQRSDSIGRTVLQTVAQND